MKTLYITKGKYCDVFLWTEEPKFSATRTRKVFTTNDKKQLYAQRAYLGYLGCQTSRILRALGIKLKAGELVTLKIQVGRPRKGKKAKK